MRTKIAVYLTMIALVLSLFALACEAADTPKVTASRAVKLYVDAMKGEDATLGTMVIDRFKADAEGSGLFTIVETDAQAGMILHICVSKVEGSNYNAIAWALTFPDTDGVEEYTGQGLILVDATTIDGASDVLLKTTMERLVNKLDEIAAKDKADADRRRKMRDSATKRAA